MYIEGYIDSPGKGGNHARSINKEKGRIKMKSE
jgi:hypothetical protein